MLLYVEYLSLGNFFAFVLKELFSERVNNTQAKTHYYIESTIIGKTIANFFGKFLGFQFEKLEFELRHIRDGRGELIRLTISRKSLFDVQEQIINSAAFRSLYRKEWGQARVDDFIRKGLIGGGVTDVNSVSRALFLIEVVDWHRQKTGLSNVKLLLLKRAWWNVYKRYAFRAGISLRGINSKWNLLMNKASLLGILRKWPRLYVWLKCFKYGKPSNVSAESYPSIPKLYLDGRGDVNLINNGYHSDFFWFMNSDFPEKNILYDFHSEEERLYLKKHGILVVIRQTVNIPAHDAKKMPPPYRNCRFMKEFTCIKSLIISYNYAKAFWVSFFQTHGINIFLTWYKYDNTHVAISDAIKEVGGIFIVYQMAFDGYRAIENATYADIVFSFSSWSDNIEKQLGSKINYNVIIGYPKDYASPLLRKEAKDLRARLKLNGAEKIVLVIDENSIDDSRWHTGHSLQRENYSFILEKVLDTPWLGVVFKPKAGKTLRRRLGGVAQLLADAEKTGRCYIYETIGRHTTIAPPILAGLSADVCIHGHLGSGTAALECALEGIPTLLIDREGCPYSKLHELPEGKVVFKDWPEAIDALMEHFQRPQGVPGFGDWSGIIDEFDPFRDGRAANRMGTYLHWLIQGYEQGLDRDAIMAAAADRYRKRWGDRFVIS
jgi:hypothetical protein